MSKAKSEEYKRVYVARADKTLVEDSAPYSDDMLNFETVLKKHSGLDKVECEILKVSPCVEAVYIIGDDAISGKKIPINPFMRNFGWSIKGPVIFYWTNEDTGDIINAPAQFTQDELLNMLGADVKQRAYFIDEMKKMGANIITVNK